MAGLLSLLQPALNLIGTPAGSPLAAFLERLAVQVDALPTPVTAVPAGQTCFVDGVNGNNTTGTEGRIDLPFRTIQAALNAASAGSVVFVWPGAVFAENLVWPQVDRISLVGLGVDAVRVRVTNNSPALTVAPLASGITQGAVVGVTFEKTAGTGAVVSIDGTGVLPAAPLAAGFDLDSVIVRNAVATVPLSVTCITNLRARDVRATGSSSSVLRELGRGLLADCSFDGLAIRYNAGGSVPPGGRNPVVLQSCRIVQIDHEGQASAEMDSGCVVDTYQAQQIACAAALAPRLIFRGEVTTTGPIIDMQAGVVAVAPVLDFSLARVQTLDLTGADATAYPVLAQGAIFPAGQGVIDNGGGSTFEVDASGSNVDGANCTILAGSLLQRDFQTVGVLLTGAPPDALTLGAGVLASVPRFILQPRVSVSPRAAMAAVAGVPFATMTGAATLSVGGTAASTVTLTFSSR